MKIKSIILIFENSEIAALSVGNVKSDIKYVNIGPINKYVSTIATNSVEEYELIEHVKLVLNPDANKPLIFAAENLMLFDRLKQNDIAVIILRYENGDERELRIRWKGKTTNELQNCETNKDNFIVNIG